MPWVGRAQGLDLRTAELIRQGGKSGAAIEPGSAKGSLLFAKISERSMPPKDELPLSEEAIDLRAERCDQAQNVF